MYFLDLLMLSLYLILTMEFEAMLHVHQKQSVVAEVLWHANMYTFPFTLLASYRET
jgi:hypothetical protein